MIKTELHVSYVSKVSENCSSFNSYFICLERDILLVERLIFQGMSLMHLARALKRFSLVQEPDMKHAAPLARSNSKNYGFCAGTCGL